jgi:hypothetical protein
MSVVDEIMAHAVPVTDSEFHEDGIDKQGNVVEENGFTDNQRHTPETEDTIIAVVNGQIIPGVELIKTQFSRAAKLGSTTGVENFLKRIAAVIDKRSHSVEDLIKFMERGDMPIADDGSILIYKLLNRTSEGKYVDCHSGKVVQFVGAYVCMDEKLVDRNRNNECSNGLHVARRGYLRSFFGNVCVMAKLDPEDVIAVPTYDANKVRVCGYHIIAELTDAQRSRVMENQPLTHNEAGRVLIAKALAGDHIRRTHEVRITEQKGGGLQTKKLDKSEAPAPVATPDAPKEVEALQNARAETGDTPVIPLDVVKTTEAAVLTRKEQAQHLYDVWKTASTKGDGKAAGEALTVLMAFKKAAKIGWDRLGIPDPTLKDAPAKPVKQSKKQKAQAKKADAAKVHTSKGEIVQVVIAGEGSYRERILKLLSMGTPTLAVAQKVFDLKKQSKKGWETLGVTPTEVAGMTQLLGL